MGLCLHPLVSVPDAVGRGTTVAPLASSRGSITMMLGGCIVLQSDDDISCSPPKSCFHLLLEGSTSRVGGGSWCHWHMLLRTYFWYGDLIHSQTSSPSLQPFLLHFPESTTQGFIRREGNIPQSQSSLLQAPSSFFSIT